MKKDSYLDAAVVGQLTSTKTTRFPSCPYLFANLTASRHAVLSSLSMLPLLARGGLATISTGEYLAAIREMVCAWFRLARGGEGGLCYQCGLTTWSTASVLGDAF